MLVHDGDEVFLGTAIATDSDRRHALLAIVVLVVAFAVTAPIARWPLRAIPQFVPIYDTAILVVDTLAAVLFYAQFANLRRRSMLVLACAYVFTPLMVAAHALSIPNAFVQGVVIGGEQTAAWLWVVWHAMFPLFIGAYAFRARTEVTRRAGPDAALRRTAALVVAGTIALALTAISLMVLGDRVIPPLMQGNTQWSRVTTLVMSATCMVHLAALVALVWYTRLRRVIDTWLAVTLVALAVDVLLSAVLVPGRFQLGWYMGRVYGLCGSLFVLAVLLRETVTLSGIARSTAGLRASEEGLLRVNDQLETRVRDRTAQINALLTRLISTQEEERRRMAGDIHDQLGQHTTALRLNLEIWRGIGAGHAALTDQADRTQRLAEDLDQASTT
jgi:signal transduction histidine kinase